MIELSETKRCSLVNSKIGGDNKNGECGTQVQMTLERLDDSCETPPDQEDVSQLATAKQLLDINSRNALVMPSSANNTGDSLTIKS